MESYTRILMDHYKHPRCRGEIDDPDVRHEIVNRTCGDRLVFTARYENDHLRDIRFDGSGCFYCLASASIICQYLTGMQHSLALNEIVAFRDWLHDQADAYPPPPEQADLQALGDIKSYPMRLGCVDLAWKGMEELLNQKTGNSL